jgi:RimJ/RimL family protein N-acetyltransferase
VTLLAWRDVERGDRRILQRFTCTEDPRYVPGRGKVHPREWELDVQAWVRGYTPPAGYREKFIIGLDDDGVGAVCAAAVSNDTPRTVALQIVAVSRRYRGQGGAVADEALFTALRAAADLGAESGWPEVTAFGRIHPRNAPSQRMCERCGFICEGDDPNADPGGPVYQIWSIAVD